MLLIRKILTFLFFLNISCESGLTQNQTNLDPVYETQQNHVLDNELLVDEFTNKSDLNNKNIDKSERQVTQETHKSVVNTKLGDDRILAILTEALNVIKTPKCYKELNYTIDSIKQQKPWAIAMYDASVKIPVGIEYGNIWQFGNFDECMAIKTDLILDGVDIKPKYCLADIEFEISDIKNVVAKRSQRQTNSTTVHFGLCTPASCSSNDIILFLSHITSGVNHIKITSNKCHTNEITTYTSVDILYGCAIIFFLMMTAFSTLYHCYTIYSRRCNNIKDSRNSFDLVMKSFSVVENLKKLVKGSSDENGLSCINGIKACAMLFILGGHALVFMLGGPVQNAEFFESASKKIQNAFLLNSPLLVDLFLLLSGFLFARLLLLELDKRNGKVNFLVLYIFRYIRLTPAYLAVIGLYATWMPKLGDGPLWDSRMGLEQERCQISWWKNLLYINNYIGNESLCMFQSWYLATDTQLFVLAPLILYPLWKWKTLGRVILGGAVAVTTVIPFLVTYLNNLDPTLLVFPDEVYDLSANEYFFTTYGKTHMRATAYVFGILVGYIVHTLQDKNISIPRVLQHVLWTISTIVGLLSMFYVTVYYHDGYHYTVLEAGLYAALHRFGWSFANGWLVLACVMGYGGPLKKFLSCRALIPFSRLTYCAYLTNGFVELYLFSSVRTGRYMSITSLLGDTLSHTILTFLAALILCLMFESPIHGIEKIFIKRSVPQKRLSSKNDKNSNVNNNNSRSTSSESAESVETA